MFKLSLPIVVMAKIGLSQPALSSNLESSNLGMSNWLGNQVAHRALDIKIHGLYKKAISCDKPEKDNWVDAKVWMKYKPPYPNWKMLNKLVQIAPESVSYAQKWSEYDKAQHCFAGCFIRQKTDYTSAVLVGWLKELNDASDCSPRSSRFEVDDYLATVAGAVAGGIVPCEHFCRKVTAKNPISGRELLKQSYELYPKHK